MKEVNELSTRACIGLLRRINTFLNDAKLFYEGGLLNTSAYNSIHDNLSIMRQQLWRELKSRALGKRLPRSLRSQQEVLKLPDNT